MTTKRIAVEFDDSLPMGTCGRFKHNGERWIAIPHHKYTRLLTVIDRMIGANTRIREDMIRWLNDWPQDGARVARALEIVARINAMTKDVTVEKTEATVS